MIKTMAKICVWLHVKTDGFNHAAAPKYGSGDWWEVYKAWVDGWLGYKSKNIKMPLKLHRLVLSTVCWWWWWWIHSFWYLIDSDHKQLSIHPILILDKIYHKKSSRETILRRRLVSEYEAKNAKKRRNWIASLHRYTIRLKSTFELMKHDCGFSSSQKTKMQKKKAKPHCAITKGTN